MRNDSVSLIKSKILLKILKKSKKYSVENNDDTKAKVCWKYEVPKTTYEKCKTFSFQVFYTVYLWHFPQNFLLLGPKIVKACEESSIAM